MEYLVFGGFMGMKGTIWSISYICIGISITMIKIGYLFVLMVTFVLFYLLDIILHYGYYIS